VEDDMENSNQSYAGNAAAAAEDTATRMKNKASDMASRAQETLEDAADEVQARAKEAGDTVRRYANEAADRLDESLQTRPMTTLIGAVVVGFVLGALWKR
jgi:ElaB/YqjD/DUF883 family membrane-anchored ribosome-binding protein